MPLSRKHYKLIADILNYWYLRTKDTRCECHRPLKTDIFDALVVDLRVELKKDNSRFDKDRFNEAVYKEEHDCKKDDMFLVH